MYITLTDLKKVVLPRCIENQDGCLEIALCEITYYVNWHNVSDVLQNNRIDFDRRPITIEDGYYNVCDLNEEVFKPNGAELNLHSPSGFLRINSSRKRIELSDGLMKTLGFTDNIIEPNQVVTGTKHPQLAIHKKLNVHLGQLSTYQNIYNGMPSTLLRAVPVENEKCGGGRTEAFSVLQYKRLMNGDFPQLSVFVLDEYGKEIELEYVSVTLHIKNG